MKFNIYKSIAVCSLVALAGCHDFEEMNTNPYQPGYIPEATENVSPNGYDIDYQLSEKALASLKERESGIGSTLYGFFYDGAWDNYQTTTNLTHDIYAGYTGNNVNGFLTQAPTYAYTEGWSANRWNQFYDKRSNAEYSELIRTFWFCDKNKYQYNQCQGYEEKAPDHDAYFLLKSEKHACPERQVSYPDVRLWRQE